MRLQERTSSSGFVLHWHTMLVVEVFVFLMRPYGSHSSACDMLLDPHCKLAIEHEDNMHLVNLANDGEINLFSVVQFDAMAFRKKTLNLFKIWRTIQKYMTMTHDNEPWNFVETVVAKIPNAGFTKSLVHYFYKRCESFPDIDAQFQSFLDADLIGDSFSFGSSVDGFDDSNFTGALSAKKLDTKKIEGFSMT